MKKIFFVSLLLICWGGFLSTVRAQSISVAPENAKVGEEVSVNIDIPQVPQDADKIDLYINGVLKQSFNPFATGNHFTHTYKWNTSSSEAGSYSINVMVLGRLEADGRKVLSTGTTNYSLLASETGEETDKTKTEDELKKEEETKKVKSAWSFTQILPSTAPEDWGLADVQTLIRNIINLAMLLAGGVAVAMILWGSYGYLAAYGNEEKAKAAKTTITLAIIGLVVIIAAEFIVALVWNFISPTPPTFPV